MKCFVCRRGGFNVKKSFHAYVFTLSLISTHMLYNISKEDFADHVRHANSWVDLGIRCGLEKNKFNSIKNTNRLLMLQQKVQNMKLNTQHFIGQNQIPDDVFKTMVGESDYLYQVLVKCKARSVTGKKIILKRIKDLCIDTTHFKPRKTQTAYNHCSKVDTIDDETFKTLLKNNRTWRNFFFDCGFKAPGSDIKKILTRRIKMLGLDTNHFDCKQIDDDKIFVIESQYTNMKQIKKRLVHDFDRPYECNACKNVNFTKRDGVLMWNNKEIVLQLEHINGVHTDNRLENLTFLCPNCHAQTSTFTGRNSKKHKISQAWVDDGKTEHPPASIASLLN